MIPPFEMVSKFSTEVLQDRKPVVSLRKKICKLHEPSSGVIAVLMNQKYILNKMSKQKCTSNKVSIDKMIIVL